MGELKGQHWQSPLYQCKAIYSGIPPGFAEAVMTFNYCISYTVTYSSLGYECMCCAYVNTGNKKSVSKVFYVT
jgi:hypothetical protein